MKKLTVLVALAALLSTAAISQADVRVKFWDGALTEDIVVNHPFAPGGEALEVGSLTIEIDLDNGQPAFQTSAYCVDLRQRVSHGWKGYDLEPLDVAPKDGGSDYSPMGTAKANAIRELWGDHAADVNSSQTAAAFQVAIWEIIYENGNSAGVVNPWTVSAGNFSVEDAAVAAVADAWLADVGDGSSLSTSLFALTNFKMTNQWQDYLFTLPGANRPPVPEPLTVATLAMAVSGLGVYVRRRTQA